MIEVCFAANGMSLYEIWRDTLSFAFSLKNSNGIGLIGLNL